METCAIIKMPHSPNNCTVKGRYFDKKVFSRSFHTLMGKKDCVATIEMHFFGASLYGGALFLFDSSDYMTLLYCIISIRHTFVLLF